MDQRHLNFNNFIKQRANQIIKFTEALHINTNKRTHQSLPKSIRRRAMSHNRYRIPFKMRKPLEQQLKKSESMQRLPKCRKSIRKKSRLILSYKRRSLKVKWLSTHLWAAKRMRMINYSGYKIAESPNNKSFRSSYRHSKHNSCLADYSYLQSLTITNKKQQRLQLPKQIKINSKQKLTENKFYFGCFYICNQRADEQFVCPLLIFPESEIKVRCFFDPFAKDLIKKMKFSQGQFEIEVQQNKLEIYFLIGPQSIVRVSEALKRLKIQSGIDESNKLCFQNRITFINGKNTRNCKPFASQQIKQHYADTYDPSQSKRLRDKFYQFLKDRKCKQEDFRNEVTQFWRFYDELGKKLDQQSAFSKEYMINITTRSKYTHKRKNKLTKEEKKKVILEQAEKRELMSVSPQRILDIKIKDAKNESPSKQNQHKPLNQEEFNEDPIMVAQFAQFSQANSILQGCFLFCSSRNNCKIWRALTQTNIKVIGKRQLKHCLFQHRVRTFPDDYPESVLFNVYNKERAVKLIDEHKKRPSQKRVSFQKINSPFPFYFNYCEKKNLLKNVYVQMVSRGRCFTGSYICRPQKQDFEQISKCIDESGVIKSVVEQQKNENEKMLVNYYNQTYQQIVENLANRRQNCKRKIIGFVTYGTYMFTHSQQGGFGFALSQYLDSQYVLVRKVTSRHYYIATLSIL